MSLDKALFVSGGPSVFSKTKKSLSKKIFYLHRAVESGSASFFHTPTSMKKLLLGAAAFAIVFAFCKKDDTTNNNNPAPARTNAITIGDDTYTYGSGLSAFQILKNTIVVSGIKGDDGAGVVYTFSGNDLPVAGTYRVIAEDSVDNLTATQVSFRANKNTDYYESTGAGAVDLKVTVSNGKYTVVMPTAPAKSSDNSGKSTTVSVDVTQK